MQLHTVQAAIFMKLNSQYVNPTANTSEYKKKV